ncbi:hypothetical protein [Streptomyces cyaneofuscatus]|uniref:hypothetical protein n=1 Tax=Streptomyces cyaneofuscatus TaxID=66883 RepID=UPI0037AEE315
MRARPAVRGGRTDRAAAARKHRAAVEKEDYTLLMAAVMTVPSPFGPPWGRCDTRTPSGRHPGHTDRSRRGVMRPAGP